MKAQLREKAIHLRISELLSYSAIREQLGVSKSTLSYWLREYPLSEKRILELRRVGWKKGEASRERFRNTMRRKRKEKELQIYETQKRSLRNLHTKAIYIAGLMLYFGEGSKKNRYTICITNTDPSLIRFFIKWLDVYLDIPRSQLHAQLHLYENMDIEKEKKFWQNTLGLKHKQFYKPQIRKLRKGSFSYKESHRHGTCQVSFAGGEKKMILMMAIKAFVDLYIDHK